MPDPPAPVPATFIERPNRFVVVAALDDGSVVRAHLPNTGRLTHLTTRGRPLILRRDGAAGRVTDYTVTRAWDGGWVGLEARIAPALLTDWLTAGNPLPGVGRVTDLRTEVRLGEHRLDLLASTPTGPVWIEVKSGGRCADGVALLSQTPSTRAAGHLHALAEVAASGGHAAAVFVYQRHDPSELLVGGDADPGWIIAVREARSAGVIVAAFACDVTETHVAISHELPIRDQPSSPPGSAGTSTA